jgi:hypothetical protein
VPRAAITRGALGHTTEHLTQEFHGRGRGTNGGAVRWLRRPMDAGELEHVGKAVAVAAVTISERLGGEQLVAEPAEAVIGAIETDQEFDDVCTEWIADAESELARRKRIVMEALEQRGYVNR